MSIPSATADRPTPRAAADVVIAGGGLIGWACARALAQRGLSVHVVSWDQLPAASGVAAGMLAPTTEVAPTERDLLQLNLASLEIYRDFVAELEAEAGTAVGLRQTPTLSVGFDADDAARLADFATVIAHVGLPIERCTIREARRLCPLLAPTIRSALLAPQDWSVDPRLLWSALRTAAAAQGVGVTYGQITGAVMAEGRCVGVELDDGSQIRGEHTVWALGAWSGAVSLPFPLPVRPVKGQVLRLRAGWLPLPQQTIRAFVRGTEIYLVPRESGELVIGATSEDQAFDARATTGATFTLLRDARLVLPMLDEYEFAEVSVGFRPATPTHSPLLGPSPVPGLMLATGHHRNGVLLTPITAALISGLIVDNKWPELGQLFSYQSATQNVEMST